MTAEIKEKAEEKAETIGEFLKQTRLKNNISISKVAEDLCIRKVYIQAIEESNHKELPPVPYGTGFVRSYAAYLGLNVERVVQLYKEETTEGDVDNLEMVEIQDEITYPSKQYIIGGIITALVIYLIYAVVSGIYGKSAEQNQIPVVVVEEDAQIIEDEQEIKEENAFKEIASQKAQMDAENSITVVDEEPSKAESIVEESQKPKENKGEVVVKIKGETWFQVKGKNKILFGKLVNKGFEYVVPDEEGVVLTIGRPFNADVYINGELKVFTTERKPIHINVDEYLNNKKH